jgi:N-acetylglucosamine-6-phosphate deacetylase
MPSIVFTGSLILPDRILEQAAVLVREGRIAAVGSRAEVERQTPPGSQHIDAGKGYISPGFVDLHVHGGAGADFMDATPEAFRTVLAAHARHGTTSIVPTTTVASHERILAALELCRRFKALEQPAGIGARVLGAHFYGPYFNREARGCHPGDDVRPPEPAEYAAYLDFADAIVTATVAPELPGAEAFVRACGERGVRTNVGHSNATFDQMAEAVAWGVRHVDHLFCAMSDKTKLRARRPYPMQGGVLEATLYFDELTTEVIADGKHLSADLLLLALVIKGPDRLALATDCNRALDMPEGRYIFGPLDAGEPFDHRDGVGVMPDGLALASSVRGMDHMVRTFWRLSGSDGDDASRLHRRTRRPLWEVVRMASLTPARIAGWEREIGSLEPGKRADLLLLGADLGVERVWIGGEELAATTANRTAAPDSAAL